MVTNAFLNTNSERSEQSTAKARFSDPIRSVRLILRKFSLPFPQHGTGKFLSPRGDYTFGQLDYDYGAGPLFPRISLAALRYGQNALFDPGATNQLNIEATVRYQPTSLFQTQFDYTKRRLVRNDTELVEFDDNIFSSRSVYQFTRNTFARLWIDYSTLKNRIRPQLVLGWTPIPGTALYAGYNDDINYNGYNPINGRFEPGFRGNGRTFFIKASYLFRKSF